jgi:hypothetical protein
MNQTGLEEMLFGWVYSDDHRRKNQGFPLAPVNGADLSPVVYGGQRKSLVLPTVVVRIDTPKQHLL